MKKIEIIGLIVFLSFLLWMIIGRNVDQSDILENGKLVNARIYSWFVGRIGTNGGFKCEFDYQGKHYKLSSPTTYKGSWPSLIGKSFPGIFSPKSKTFEILITSEDFAKFKIPFPDSLNWVSQEAFK